MKSLISFALLTLVAFASCHKKSTTSCSNTVTVVDGANTYSGCGSIPHSQHITSSGAGQVINNVVSIRLYKEDTSYALEIIAAANFPFAIHFNAIKDGSGRTGLYTVDNTNYPQYLEYFSGGQSYFSIVGNVSVINADVTNVSGTFTITVANSAGSKEISGLFNFNDPVIE